MSALGRTMMALCLGFPPDPADAEELGRIFDATPLYGVDPGPPGEAVKPRALRKLTCPACEVEEIRLHTGQVIRRLRRPCPAHRSRRP